MKLRLWVIWVMLAGASTGCVNKEAEENARKAALYDAAQTAGGNNDKQRKLEDCFNQAERFAKEWGPNRLRQMGCLAPDGNLLTNLPLSQAEQCADIAQINRDGQDKNEARCTQLYK
jgi:hypothetical protein